MSYQNGWLPDIYDANDKPYRCQMHGPVKETVNLFEEHPEWLQKVYDQGQTGSCTANAVAAAFRFLAHKMESSSTPLVIEPSRLFIYYYARALPVLESTDQYPSKLRDVGCSARNAMKAIKAFGVCSEETWPYDALKINELPTEKAHKEAKLANVFEYCRLDPDQPGHIEDQMTPAEKKAVGVVTLALLRQCLSEGYPVVFGFQYYWDHPPWNKEKETWLLPALPESQQHSSPPEKYDRAKGTSDPIGGHTVLAIGYNDSKSQVLCQNSWGNGLDENGNPTAKNSKDGIFWMDYSWITDWEATDDFWMIREIQQPKKDADLPSWVPASLLCNSDVESELDRVERAFFAAGKNRQLYSEYRFDRPVGENGVWPQLFAFNDVVDIVEKVGSGKWPTRLIVVCGKGMNSSLVRGIRLCYGDITLTHGRDNSSEPEDSNAMNLAEGEKIKRIKIYKQHELEGNEVGGIEVWTDTNRSRVWKFPSGFSPYQSIDLTPPAGFTGLKGFFGHGRGVQVLRLGPIWGR